MPVDPTDCTLVVEGESVSSWIVYEVKRCHAVRVSFQVGHPEIKSRGVRKRLTDIYMWREFS